jgi:hypothetical protein
MTNDKFTIPTAIIIQRTDKAVRLLLGSGPWIPLSQIEIKAFPHVGDAPFIQFRGYNGEIVSTNAVSIVMPRWLALKTFSASEVEFMDRTAARFAAIDAAKALD